MSKKLILSLALTLLLTTISTAATISVPVDYGTIQEAIDNAGQGDTIIVDDDTYYERDIDFGDTDKNLTIQSESGDPNLCTIDCSGGRCFYFHAGETSTTVIQGFKITGGTSDYGGAIECEGSSPTINNCIIENCSADFGGAIDIFYASPLITNCVIKENDSTYDGSVIECSGETLSGEPAKIFNCLIYENTAGRYGAIDCYDDAYLEIINCTIADNTGNDDFGGIYAIDSTITVRNSILWNNGINLTGTGITVSYSCVQNGCSGTGNIETDPMFRTGPLGNYYLSQILAGQLADSNCVHNCIDSAEAIFGVSHTFTTSTHNDADSDNVDMGYHYPDSGTTVQFQLTTVVDPVGAGTIDPNLSSGQYYNQYGEVKLTATPVGSYRFMKWLEGSTIVEESNTVYVVQIDADKTVTARFSTVETYKLTTYVKGGNGSITNVDPNDYPDVNDSRVYYIPKDTDANITVTSNIGYILKQWYVGDTETFDINDPFTYEVIAPTSTASVQNLVETIDADTTVVAEFKSQQYLLTTAVSGGNGSILPKRGYYPAGTTVSLVATPYDGYRVHAWGKDAATQPGWNMPTNTVVMNSAKDVNVMFEVSTNKVIHVPGTYPYTTIQDAINNSSNGDTIKIAPGTYPGAGFTVDKYITIVGDPENPESVVIDGNNYSNRIFVLDGSNGAVITLNGLTIKNAKYIAATSLMHDDEPWDANYTRSNDDGPDGGDAVGAGIYVYGSHIIRNCIIQNCLAQGSNARDGRDGAVWNISDHELPIHKGGFGGDGGTAAGAGIYVSSGSPIIKNTIIKDCNAVAGNGGNGGNGLAASTSDPMDTNFPGGPGGNGGNGGSAIGGAVCCVQGTNPTFIDCTIINCQARSGYGGDGGIGGAGARLDTVAYDPCSPFAFIQRGYGQGGHGGMPGLALGGGVYIDDKCTAKFENCKITENSAQSNVAGSGGNSSEAIDNSSFFLGGLGGLVDVDTVDRVVKDAVDDAATVSEGDLDPNTLILPNQIHINGTITFGMSADDIKAMITAISPEVYTAKGGGLYIGGVDTYLGGTSAGPSQADFNNCEISNNWTKGSTSGIGGYNTGGLISSVHNSNYEYPSRHYREPSYGNGVYLADDSNTIFLNSKVEGNFYTIEETTNIYPLAHDQFISGSSPVTGHPGTESDTTANPPYTYANMYLDIYGNEYLNYGGGLCFDNWVGATQTTITDCNVTDNNSANGGGIFASAADVYIADSNISNNRSYSGGGVMLLESTGLISKTLVKDNAAGTILMDVNQQSVYALYGSGGGIYLLSSLVDVNDTTVTGNSARATGGGICIDGDWPYAPYTQPLIKNCLITDNSAVYEGGGIAAIFFASPTIQNCTIVKNHTTDVNSAGSGLFASYSADVIIKDSILWENGLGNSGINGSQIALSSANSDMPSSARISYSDIQTAVLDTNQPMDVVILIDTTGSMSSVLDSIKEAAGDVVDRIAEKTSDYRIAVVDFRDYPDGNCGSVGIDYTYNDDLEFTSIRTAVQNAIDSITIGSGMDWEESVYSAVIHCADGNSLGNWRTDENVNKLILLMGDAPGHDPCEPYGDNYTLQNAIDAAANKGIKIYSILTGSGVNYDESINDFNSLAIGTGGALIKSPDGSTASTAVIRAIDLATLPSTYIYLDDTMCSIVGLTKDSTGTWSVNGSSNISEDPNFISGYYLSHIETGQNIDSVCIDAGSATAATLDLDTYTTRLDGGLDSGYVDIGYHYDSSIPQYNIIVKILTDANYPGIHGTITADPNRLVSYDSANATYTYKFYRDTDVVLTAVSDSNYYVKGWYDQTDALVSSAPSLTFTAAADSNYFVRFKPTRTVSVSGGGTALQEAVDAAENGDILIVAAGTYTGDIDLGGKQIKLFGVKPDNASVVEKTVIDCNGGSRGFIFSGGETSSTVIDGFTITNGGADDLEGGAIYIARDSSPLIINVDISDCNISNANGGAIYIGTLSEPEFRNITITNCRTINGYGGGVYVNNNSGPIFKNCSFTSCYAGLSGGAIYNSIESTTEITGCTFTTNSAGTSAGAVYYAEGCTGNLTGCEFTDNSAGESGGAVLYAAESGFDVNNCNFTNNSSSSFAGAIYISEDCDGTIENADMSSNTATDDGGAIYILNSGIIGITDCEITSNTALRGGGIYAITSPDVTITNCEMSSNKAYGSTTYQTDPNDANTVVTSTDFVAQGGAVFAFASIEKITGCTITSNTAITSGGAIYIGGEQSDVNYPQIFNCLITKNKAGSDGGAISVNWYANATIQNCTLSGNVVTNITGNGGGLYCSYGAQANIKDSIFWANTGIEGSQIAVGSGDTSYPLPGSVNVTYSDVDMRTEAAFDSLDVSTTTSTSSSSVLVDETTIYNEINTNDYAKVIVSLTEPVSKSQITDWSNTSLVEPLRTKIAALQTQVLSTLTTSEFTVKHKLTNSTSFSGTVTAAGLTKLMSNSLVAHIEPVRVLSPMLAQGLPLMNALDSRGTYNGSGIAIAIVDTGVDYTHSKLGGGSFPNYKVIGGYDTGSDDSDPMPVGEAHGTCCSGIAAGSTGTVSDYIGGVAYNAKIYALKASQDNLGEFYDDDILAAWDWCITHQNDNSSNPIMVISNSFGGGSYSSATQADNDYPSFAEAVETANAAGITILASSGNEAYTSGIAFPAALSGVISVGAVYDTSLGGLAFENCTDTQTSADKVTCYSNTADILDILAPSHNAYTPDIVGTDGYSTGDYDSEFGGTSAACPYAAGAVAALQSAAKQLMGEYLTPDEVRTILKTTGDSVTDTKVAITKPRVNLGAAIALLSESEPIYVDSGCTLTGFEQDTSGTWVPALGGTNIGQDPNFILGYYLSHVDAGQDYNSPCFDIGDVNAADLGLDVLTTRADDFKDEGVVDLGYHYSNGITRYELYVDVNFADVNYAGTVDPCGSSYYYDGETVKIIAIPDVNTRVAYWVVDGTTIDSHDTYYNITMDRTHNVTVEFEFHTPQNLIVPDQYATIQEAINAAGNGDTIYIYKKANGNPHYISDIDGIDLKGKAVTIRSENPDDPNVVAETIIDCNNRGRAFIFQNNEDANSIIEGLTITNGLATGGISTDTDPVYDPCGGVIYYNGVDATGDGFGGAIYCDSNTSPIIRKCVFTNCQVTGGQGSDGGQGYDMPTSDPPSWMTRGSSGGDGGSGSGNGFGGVIFCDKNSGPTILDCSFSNNIARGGVGGDGGNGGNGTSGVIAGDGGDGGNGVGNGYGGVVYCTEGSSPKITKCSFSENLASTGLGGSGGLQGIGVEATDDPYPYDGSDGSSSGIGFGGVIYYEEGSFADVDDCKFLNNTVTASSSDTSGGGAIYFEPSCASIRMVNSNLAGNKSEIGSGGAISFGANNNVILESCYFGGNSANINGGALIVGSENDSNICDINFTNCAFTGNIASELGGGIYAKNTDANLTDCFINRNTADSGGGLYFVADSTLKVHGGTMMQNKAINSEAEGGGAMMLHVPAEFINCQITGNTSQYSGGGIMFKGIETSDSKVHNCLFVENSAYARGGAILTTVNSSPTITSCTFSLNETEVGGSGGAVFCTYSSSPIIKDCIFDRTKRVAIYENSADSDPVISFCMFNSNYDGDFYNFNDRLYDTYNSDDSNTEIVDMNSATAGHNKRGELTKESLDISETIFSSGTLGDYYLKQTSIIDSNFSAVDAGSNDANKISVLNGQTMADYTTRTDDVKDSNTVDIGFHYMDSNDAKKFSLTTTVIGGNGTVEPSSGNYPAGTTVELTASPDTGWRVKEWSGTDDDSTTNTTNYVVMISDRDVSVSFEQPKDIYVPAEYTTLQDAINDAKSGDKIIVSSGTYQYSDTNYDYSAVTISGKNITITSTNPDDPCVVASTIFWSSRFSIMDVDSSMVLDGITIKGAHYSGRSPDCPDSPISPDGVNGYSITGGAMVITNASPTIRNVRFVDCSATGGNGTDNCSTGGDGGWAGFAQGGAVYINSASNPVFKNCQFIDCYVMGGNGGDGDSSDDTPGHGGNWGDPNGLVSHTWDYADGRGSNGGYADYWFYSGYGGAIYCSSGSNSHFEDCTFSNNRCFGGVCGTSASIMWPWPQYNYVIDSFGGAIYMAAGSDANFVDCNFVNNRADTRNQIGDANQTYDIEGTLSDPVVSYGGAICSEGTSIPVVKGCTFTGNTACAGGAMYWEDSIAHISSSTFTSSNAMLGGAILLIDSNSVVYDSTFTSNTAYSPAGQGGAIYCASGSAKFYDCQIMSNNADVSGGGAYLTGELEPNLHNCLFAGNIANRDGGGISANWDVQLRLSNCTVVRNEASGSNFATSFGGGLSAAYEANVDIINSIFWNNNAAYGTEMSIGNNFDAADKYKAEITVQYSDIKNGASGIFCDDDSGCILNGFDDIPSTNLSGTSLSNPAFVSRDAWGDYFLDNADVNDSTQEVNSVCVDSGFGTALQNYMYRHTTRTDLELEVPDSNVDMGYHYTRTAEIVGDLDYDGDVEFDDVAAFMQYWMQDDCFFPYFCYGRDFSEDGEVDFEDYALLAENYGAIETTPPTPNPMSFKVVPYSESQTSIGMTATTAKDNSGSIVEYEFECVSGSGGGNSRDWDPCSTYIDEGLTTGVQYGYRVRARDARDNRTGWSHIHYAVAGADTTAPTPSPMTWLVAPYVVSANSVSMTATTATDDTSGVQYSFEETTGNSGGTDSGWIDGTVYEDFGLEPNTTYTYRVKARDTSYNLNETLYSTAVSVTTPAEGEDVNDVNSNDIYPPTPNPSQWSVTPYVYLDTDGYYHTMTAVEADDNSPPIEYEFECYEGSGDDSGWISEPNYTCGPYFTARHSTYRVRSRDSLGNTGEWSVKWNTDTGLVSE